MITTLNLSGKPGQAPPRVKLMWRVGIVGCGLPEAPVPTGQTLVVDGGLTAQSPLAAARRSSIPDQP